MSVAIVVVAAFGGVVPAKTQRRQSRLIGAPRQQPPRQWPAAEPLQKSSFHFTP